MSESDQPLAWRLRSIVGEENVLADEPMSEHTTFKVGGPADLFVTPEDPDEVREVLLACDEAGVSRFVMGRGSDLLVSDDGYRGVEDGRIMTVEQAKTMHDCATVSLRGNLPMDNEAMIASLKKCMQDRGLLKDERFRML